MSGKRERDMVLKRVAAAIIEAQKRGHYVEGWQMDEFLYPEEQE